MLQELDQVLASREKFFAAYGPVRTAFENFLRRGTKVEGKKVLATAANIWNYKGHTLFPGWRPYYTRQIEIDLRGTPIPLLVETDRHLYLPQYSGQIDKAVIKVTVGLRSEPFARVAFIPPIEAFRDLSEDALRMENFLDVPQRLSDILPLLPR